MPDWESKIPDWHREAAGRLKVLAPHLPDLMPFSEMTIEVTVRRSGAAGIAWHTSKRIWLHGAMSEAHAKATYLHELAHVCAYWYGGPWGLGVCRVDHHHDDVWRMWARLLGDDGGRCHNYMEVSITRRNNRWAKREFAHVAEFFKQQDQSK